jgi:hypothetical protein
LPSESDPADFLAALVGKGVRVREFVKVEDSLEELYLKVSGAGAAGADDKQS